MFSSVFAQTPTITSGWPPLQVIDVEQGLPQAFVSGVLEDEQGFIWISTLGGLARYDGHQMLSFPHRPDDSTSPSGGAITIMKRAGRGNSSPMVWLFYDSGIVELLNARTGRCQLVPQLAKPFLNQPIPRHLLVDHLGNLWGILGQQGIFHYSPDHKRFTSIHRKTHGLCSDTINAITEDHQGHILVTTPRGISSFTPAGDLLSSTLFPQPNKVLQQIAIQADKGSSLMLPNGEIVLNNRTHLLFIHPQQLTIRFVAFAANPTRDQPLLNKSPDGTIYLVAGGRLYRYTEQQGLVPIWQYKPPEGAPFKDLFGTSLCIDRSGVLWLGANTKGLFRLDLAAMPIQTYQYRTTFCTDAVEITLGLSLQTYFQWPFDVPARPTSYVFRSAIDKQQNVWMAIGGEVGYMNSQTHRFTSLTNLGKAALDDANGFLRGISITPNGQIWIVSNTGTPFRYDTATQNWQTPFGKKSLDANDLVADDQTLWVSTSSHGLLRFDQTTHRYQSIRFTGRWDQAAPEQLLDLYQDSSQSDWLWIGSFQGLISYNKRTGRYRRFTTAQGLPDNTVYSILPDRQGYLWLSTNRGLCRFHPLTHSTLIIGRSDGLPGEEFNRFHQLILPDGRLAFGGVKGWVLFDPSQIKGDSVKPVVALTNLKLNNQLIDPFRPQSILQKPLNEVTQLSLNYNQNYVTVDFAALRYHQPDRVTYRYQLQGYDRDWTLSQQPTANYTQLPAGHYTLMVQAANAVGEWGSAKILPVVVRPPIWASAWAYIGYGLLLGTLVVGLVRFRARRNEERQELIRRQQQADQWQQEVRTKTRFFANVSHELRTPLTLMLGPLESVLNHGQLEPKDQQLIQIANNNAHQLLNRIRDLLELTRLETDKIIHQPRWVTLRTLLEEIAAPFQAQATQVGLTFIVDLKNVPTGQVSLDVGKVRQILENLLSNACKFTPAKGTVILQASSTTEALQVQVRDSGRGIHPDDLPHIFERYFQTRQAEAPLEGGTGIGLALCQELVQFLGGQLSVQSTWRLGTTFFLDLPISLIATHTEVDSQPVWSNSTSLNQSLEQSLEVNPETGMPPETILIVEDNSDLQLYLSSVLSPELSVLQAAHGQAALDLLSELPQPPALIISDIMMPVMDGFQLLEALKSHPVYRSIPVVMLTARTDMADKLRALRLGVDDYLLKPFDEIELKARVSNLLHNQWERRKQIDTDSLNPITESTPPMSAVDMNWLEQVEQLTLNRLSRFDLTADDLADELSMSRSTFYRAMKRLTGLTPVQYLTEARFQEARRLLENRQAYSVKQVAYQVGFRQISHFAHSYQKRFGKRPSDYS